MNESATSARRRRRPSRGKIAIAVAAVALAGYGAWTYFAGGEEEAGYLYATINFGDIEDLVTATGTLEPRDKVDVGAQVSGQIEKLLVEVGDQVKAGDVLAEIDATTAMARVEANRASLRAQESNLQDRYTQLEKAERDFNRQKNLRDAGASTEEQYLNAETALKNARQSIETLKANIEQQKASMRVEEANLQYTTIKAPIDGTVVSIAAKQGQTINASQSAPTILTIADLNTMTVRAEVSEADYNKLSVGMPAYFTTLNSTTRRWQGTLKRIEPTPKVQNSVVLYYALFDVQNDKQNDNMQLMPGMTAQVFFVSAEARNVLVMPVAAMQQGQQLVRELGLEVPGRNNGAGGPPAGGPPADGAPAPTAGSAPAGDAVAAGAPPAGAPRGEGRRQGGGGFPPGGPGGFDPSTMTPEQLAEMRARIQQNGGGRGGPGGFGGGFGGGMRGMGAGNGQQQTRRGVVVVRKGEDQYEARPVVIGVSDRVHGQVLEGLSEGEEVIVGRRDTSPAAATNTQNQMPNNFRGQGGFPGGGGGFRPF